MIKALLDCPWPIETILDRYSPFFLAVVQYQTFLSVVPIEDRARFISEEERISFYLRLSQSSPHGGWVGNVIRFVEQHVSHDLGQVHANLPDGPADLGSPWRRALRQEMGDLSNWRTPQILVCPSRSTQWHPCVHDFEVRIALEDLPNVNNQSRVVVFIGAHSADQAHRHRTDYIDHKYAQSDVDPWDVRRCNQPSQHEHFECRLPRPGELDGVGLENLETRLNHLRSQPWPDRGRYYFIPPAGWTHSVEKAEWRGQVFEERMLNGRRGPADYLGQVWHWDYHEGHWDVQQEGGIYVRVTQNGECLD